MANPLSPLAPPFFPVLPPVQGVRLAAGAAGIRYQGRTDLLIAELAPGTTVAGVYTKSLTRSAPVDWCREAQKGGTARFLVVNSGNSNAFTGRAGQDSVERTAKAAAALLACSPSEVFIASTGVIGEPLPDHKITHALPALAAALTADSWESAAEAIRTTDTFPKAATTAAVIDGVPIHLNGIAKGSGMIAPDMATMLGFLFTDAAIAADVLQSLLASATEKSFNCVTVDGDTSTSDTVLLFATGQANHAPITAATDPRAASIRAALETVCIDLAQLIARDGEGARKLITVTVEGAVSDQSAKIVALAIANSPLVKTAIAGEDANWGRIVMAVGKAGQPADRDRLAIWFGGLAVARDGQRIQNYDEAQVNAHLKGKRIEIKVDLGLDAGAACVWTCDLTHGYIDINGSYRS